MGFSRVDCRLIDLLCLQTLIVPVRFGNLSNFRRPPPENCGFDSEGSWGIQAESSSGPLLSRPAAGSRGVFPGSIHAVGRRLRRITGCTQVCVSVHLYRI